MVASSYMCQPNHSYVVFPFHLNSDLTRGLVSAGAVYQRYPTRGNPRVLFIGPWPQFSYLHSICLVFPTCCDATITQHKCNTNIHKLCTLPNTLLVILVDSAGYSVMLVIPVYLKPHLGYNIHRVSYRNVFCSFFSSYRAH